MEAFEKSITDLKEYIRALISPLKDSIDKLARDMSEMEDRSSKDHDAIGVLTGEIKLLNQAMESFKNEQKSYGRQFDKRLDIIEDAKVKEGNIVEGLQIKVEALEKRKHGAVPWSIVWKLAGFALLAGAGGGSLKELGKFLIGK